MQKIKCQCIPAECVQKQIIITINVIYELFNNSILQKIMNTLTY